MKPFRACQIVSMFILGCQSAVWGQYATVLAQDREGSAAVYFSSNNAFAYIIDGGEKGGLTKAQLDGKPVLQALLDKGCRTLVIACSHPHDDHAAGLREIIRSDSNIEKFDALYFVDSAYPEKEAFFTLFKQWHPAYSTERVSYESGMSRDAFSKISHVGDGVHVSNFVYDPEPGSAEHGHAIISHITLEKDGKRVLMVDFDDADSKLVAKWANWAKQDSAGRRPDVAVVPHHCSDRTDIDPLLNESIRPKSCIITVNPGNRYLHPGPITFQKWINAVGIENVHITGASENVCVTENGLPSIDINDKVIFTKIHNSIIQPNLAAINLQITRHKEKSDTTYKKLVEQRNVLRKVQADYAKLGGIVPPVVAPPPPTHVCEICGSPAVGWCHMRKKWVCETDRYFTQDGAHWRCP